MYSKSSSKNPILEFIKYSPSEEALFYGIDLQNYCDRNAGPGGREHTSISEYTYSNPKCRQLYHDFLLFKREYKPRKSFRVKQQLRKISRKNQKQFERLAEDGKLIPLKEKGEYVTIKQFFNDMAQFKHYFYPWKIHQINVIRICKTVNPLEKFYDNLDEIVEKLKSNNTKIHWRSDFDMESFNGLESLGKYLDFLEQEHFKPVKETFWISQIEEQGGWDSKQLTQTLKTIGFTGQEKAPRIDYNLDLEPAIGKTWKTLPATTDNSHRTHYYWKKYEDGTQRLRLDCHEFAKGNPKQINEIFYPNYSPLINSKTAFLADYTINKSNRNNIETTLYNYTPNNIIEINT